MLKQTLTLNNGVRIPVVGLGTWQTPDAVAERAVSDAIQLGYRHIDTAAAYENESGVGRGIKKGGIDRKELFITSKIPAEYKSYDVAVKTIRESLKLLDTDYVDLMLIHAPRPWDEMGKADGYDYNKENIQVYKALEQAYKAKKIRAIGVSNFSADDIKNITDHCEIVPAVNQISCFIGRTPLDTIEYCRNYGIAIEAYSPIATGALLHDAKIGEVAARYGVSIPRLCIKYVLQLGTVALPKTIHKEYMAENAKLDFVISADDMNALKKIVW